MAKNNNTRNYRMDFTTMTLTMTAEFAKNAYEPDTQEYAILTRLQKDFPNLRIVKRTHKTPTSYTTKSGEKTSRNQYKDLTYDRMEKFIEALPEHNEYLREYKAVKAMAKIAKANGYPLVRKWFEKQFPQYRKNPLFYIDNAPDLVKASEVIQEAEKEAASAGKAA